MAGKIPLWILSVLVYAAPLCAIEKAYHCKSENGHISLQDSSCSKDQEQTILEVTKFSVASDSAQDGLRPLELTVLERLHDLDLLRAQYVHERKNILAYESAKSRHAQSMEKLRHKHALEMFDKHYRHFYVYGASNNAYGGGYPFSYSVSGFGCNGATGGAGGSGGVGSIGGAASDMAMGGAGSVSSSTISGDGSSGSSGSVGGAGGLGGAGGTGCNW